MCQSPVKLVENVVKIAFSRQTVKLRKERAALALPRILLCEVADTRVLMDHLQ